MLDLKYGISPRNTTNPRWCAGALALHIPHRSVDSLLSINKNQVDITSAYKYYHTQKVTNSEGRTVPKYPSLLKFEGNETDRYTDTNSNRSLHFSQLTSHNSEKLNYLNETNELETLDDGNSDDPKIQSEDLDIDLCDQDSSISATSIFSKAGCKAWSGYQSQSCLNSDEPMFHVSMDAPLPLTLPNEISKEHMGFVSRLLVGENPISKYSNNEVLAIIQQADGTRKIAANNYLRSVLQECKTEGQRKALVLITDVLNTYCFRTNNTNTPADYLKTTPVITMVGVPGAGKSWIVNKIRTWID